MLRRISVIVASAAMLALSALPASAAAMQSSSSTHKISFPGLHGLSAWGTYQRTGSKVKLNVCVKDTVRGVFAVSADAIATNAGRTRTNDLGAVAFGFNQTICRSQTLRYGSHLRVYTFEIGSNGKVTKQSKSKTLY